MNRTLKSFAAASLVVALGAAALPATANAGGGWYYNNYNNNGAAVATGIIGFAAGAIVGSALSGPRYYAPQPYAYQPRPVYNYQPAPVYYGPPAPWTAQWYSYCGSKYRSFNPSTGYFLGYDGRYHFCR
jgi:hypothetical protein